MTPNNVGDSPPSGAWLFAQAILGRPIPRIVRPEAKAKAQREELGRQTEFSFRHAEELRSLQSAEAEARHHRQLLEWVAQISTEADEKLSAIKQVEAQQRRAWHAIERFSEADSLLTEWNEADHPRAPKGTAIGGQWIEKGGGGGGTSTGGGRPASSKGPSASGDNEPNPHMLDLAHTWWQTKGALEQTRRDLEELPKRIAREKSQLGHGGRYAYIHTQNLAKARKDLETAKALLPQLEAQSRNLKQEYHDAGFDEVPYSTFTPAETIAGGKGIEEVGRAVARRGTPRGLQSTGIEFEIASAALAGPAILRLGKAVLGKALRRVRGKLAGTVDDFVAKLPRSSTPKTTPANQYEIKQTGSYNYTVSGGGAKFDIDGYRGSTILEAKHVGNSKTSPYVPGSSCPPKVRTKILKDVRDELRRARTIIESGSTPFKEVEIITNSPGAKKFFEGLLKETGVPGKIRLEP